MEFPKVSIIIPVFNGSNFLEKAINCALQQTYRNIEIIVVNDGSTDCGETERIALSYGENIRYFYKPNGGVSSALNYGLANMTGEYVSWLSHDDEYSPTKIQDAIDLLASNEAIGKKVLAFTGGYYIDSYGARIRKFPCYFKEQRLYDGADVVRIMTRKGTLNGCCMLIPKHVFEDVGSFDETLRYSQDSLMWYKIFLAGYSLVSDNKQNVMYRLHRNQTSQLRRDLYEHDALVVAKLLAEPLEKADKNHELLYRYICRLTKYRCKEAIQYMRHYAEKNNCWGVGKNIELSVHDMVGVSRYNLVCWSKKLLLLLRH